MRQLNSFPEILPAAKTLLVDYLNVKARENVVVTIDSDSDPMASDALLAAAEAVGARPTVVKGSRLPFQGALADPFISEAMAEVVKAADVWIDLCWPYMAGSHAHDQAMASKKVRYCLAGDIDARAIERLIYRVDLARLEALANDFRALMADSIGKRCRITCPRGTEFEFEIGKGSPKENIFFVPGSLSIPLNVDSVKGRVVLSSVFHEYYTELRSPITLHVDGQIRSIEGEGIDSVVMDRALRRASNGEYGRIIHLTLGVHPSARWTGRSFIEDMRVLGNNAIGFGVPFWLPGGGENHPDGVVRNQSVWIEGRQIVENGVIVAPPSLATQSGALLPQM